MPRCQEEQEINLRSGLFCLPPAAKENMMPNKRLPSRGSLCKFAGYDIYFYEGRRPGDCGEARGDLGGRAGIV